MSHRPLAPLPRECARDAESTEKGWTGSTGSTGCSLKRITGLTECRNKPFDSTQGHESFDFAQDPEALEGQRRMASLFHHSLTPMPANAPHWLPRAEALSESQTKKNLVSHPLPFESLRVAWDARRRREKQRSRRRVF